MRLSPGTALLPIALIALYWKFTAFNALISPGGVGLPVANQAILAACVLLVAPILFAPAGWRLPLLLVVDAVLSSLALADTLYLRYFGELAPASALFHGSQGVQVAGSVRDLLRPSDAMILADLPLLVAALVLTRRWKPTPWPLGRVAAAGLGVAGLIGPSVVLTGVVGDFDRAHPDALEGAWNPTYVAASIGALPYHGIDAYHALAARAPADGPPHEVAAIADWLARKNLPEAANRDWAIASGKNLIMVQVEALQGFTVGLTIGGQPVTPNLNRLAGQSLYFSNIYGQTKHGNTSDSEFMANTSLYPATRGAAFVRFSGNAFESLPGALKERGYQTVAMHANSPGFWNRQAMYASLGFSRFESVRDYTPEDVVGLGLSDRAFFDQSLEKLTRLQAPFYSWLVTMSSHHPYHEAAALSPLDVGDLEGTRLGHYLKAIHYADAQLGRFRAGLEQRGLWDRSVVVVLGDHPGVQREDAEALVALTGNQVEGPFAWRSLQKIPVMIHLPKGARKGRIEVAGGHVDVLPTVSNLLGLPSPHAFGQDLLRAQPGFVVFNDGSFVSGDTFCDPREGQAYDVATGARRDPAPHLAKAPLAQRHLGYSGEILTFDLGDRLRALAPATGRRPSTI
jgi:phosphoglycerol transferase MdoB-like AlkP superfamily enzyme